MTAPVQQVDLGGGNYSTLDVTGAAVVIKATPGVLATIVLITVGATATNFYDTNTTGSVGASNMILSAPPGTTVGTIFSLSWPCLVGITVVPGTSSVWALAWN